MNRVTQAIAGFLRRLGERLDPAPADLGFDVVAVRTTTAPDAAWDKALTEYVLSIGTKTRATAAAWATSAAGLLALLSATAFLKGRETLDAIAEPWRPVLLAAVAVSLIAAFASLYVAALGGQGTPSPQFLAPDTYRNAQFQAADDAARLLNRSRSWVVLAFLGAMLAGGVALAAPASPSGSTSTLIVGSAGTFVCGKLEVTGNTLTVNGAPLPNPALSFHTVKECPK